MLSYTDCQPEICGGRELLELREKLMKNSLLGIVLVGLLTVPIVQAETAAQARNGLILASLHKKNKVYAVETLPASMTVNQKKDRFRALLLPPAQKVYRELNATYIATAEKIQKGDRSGVDSLKRSHKVTTDEELLAALKPHPVSIVLAQAAMESSWATSRFIREANNAFGIWSVDKNEPRIAAGEKRGKKTIWLRKYESLEASVRDSYALISRSSAFKEFRALRLKTDDPYELVKKLNHYSEIGHKYGKQLTSIIKFNKFNKYDQG